MTVTWRILQATEDTATPRATCAFIESNVHCGGHMSIILLTRPFMSIARNARAGTAVMLKFRGSHGHSTRHVSILPTTCPFVARYVHCSDNMSVRLKTCPFYRQHVHSTDDMSSSHTSTSQNARAGTARGPFRFQVSGTGPF